MLEYMYTKVSDNSRLTQKWFKCLNVLVNYIKKILPAFDWITISRDTQSVYKDDKNAVKAHFQNCQWLINLEEVEQLQSKPDIGSLLAEELTVEPTPEQENTGNAFS